MGSFIALLAFPKHLPLAVTSSCVLHNNSVGGGVGREGPARTGEETGAQRGEVTSVKSQRSSGRSGIGPRFSARRPVSYIVYKVSSL